jgi:hypothetical protein
MTRLSLVKQFVRLRPGIACGMHNARFEVRDKMSLTDRTKRSRLIFAVSIYAALIVEQLWIRKHDAFTWVIVASFGLTMGLLWLDIKRLPKYSAAA